MSAGAGPFGVVLPDNIGSEAAEVKETPNSVGDSAPEGAAPEKVSKEAAGTEKAQEILELDKLERFRFGGKEWSPKDLRNATLRHEDYTRKTQEVAEARKYAENFPADLRTVLREPHRLQEFRQLYGKYPQYVEHAESLLKEMGQRNGQPQGTQQPENDPYASRFEKIEGVLSQWSQAQQEAQTKQIESWLDNQFETLSKKYTYADPEVITARAEVASRSGTQITPEVLEKLFKANDSEVKDRFDRVYSQKVTKQLETSRKGKDVGTGGGIPGGAPKGFKTIKEATNAFLADIEASR